MERQIDADVLDEIVQEFKGCNIQSDEQVDTTIDSEEHVDARNWLRNNSAKQVDAISDSEKLVVDGSDPKIYSGVSTHTTNNISATDITNGISKQNYFSNQPSKLLSDPLPRSSPPNRGSRKRV